MRCRSIFCVAAVLLLANGCMSWSRGWEERPALPGAAAQQPTAPSMSEASAMLDQAGDEASLEAAIAALSAASPATPLERHTLLAEAYVLYGAAYANERDEKKKAYEQGLRHAELAMATHQSFLERVERGESVAAASEELGQAEARAMLIWVTGVSYYFREVLSPLGRVASFRTIGQTEPLLERLLEIDREMEQGAVPFSLAIHYIARPPWAGQDLERAEQLFDEAIAISPRSLLIRWGRAKYLHAKRENESAMREDLEWVLAQDPRSAATPFHWNVYLQRDARAMLAELNQR